MISKDNVQDPSASPERAFREQEEPLFSIGTTARKTGLTVDLIRAWERRYKVVKPQRTQGRHRLYSQNDVERLDLLRRASLHWRRIGKIAHLSNETLVQIIEQEEQLEQVVTEQEAKIVSDACVQASLDAVQGFDSHTLQNLLEDAWIEMDVATLVAEVLAPLMRTIGDRWAEGSMNVAHEHLATSVVQPFLKELARNFPCADNAPVAAFATPPSQPHELGTLFAVAVTAAEGWKVHYLGGDLPVDDLAAACHKLQPRVLGLGITLAEERAQLLSSLNRLRRQLDPTIQLLVGGEGARHFHDEFKLLRAQHIADLGHLQAVLSQSL